MVAQIGLEDVGGWQVVLASSGQEGLSLAEKHQPDLILLDVMMPAMDGPTTLSKLRSIPALANMPVIFLTAKVQKHEIAQYLEEATRRLELWAIQHRSAADMALRIQLQKQINDR